MAPRTRYEALPRRSSESSLSLSSYNDDEFKDKPIRRRSPLRRTRRLLLRSSKPLSILLFLGILVLCQILFNAPYAASNAPSFTPNTQETVFIAANIIDGDLVTGVWGRSLQELVEKIGKDRVFVSIYGGPPEALLQLESMLECPSAIVSEDADPIHLDTIPHTSLPNGEKRVKRIAFLAEVRNKALAPLETHPDAKGRKWDKVLFINDVYFQPEGALRLLWGTNLNEEGKAEYKAVCASDFVASWKYYDTFATRDAEGYSIGIPIFPWFGSEGDAVTRGDVLGGRDSVRVKSCWGGMVAFDGRYFVDQTESNKAAAKTTTNSGNTDLEIAQLPLRFRSEAEPFWDSSECCLIHADIMSLPSFPTSSASTQQNAAKKEMDPYDTGIYMNPFVRVAYDAQTFRHISLAIRFEALFAIPQRIINYFASMPRYNYRRSEIQGQTISDKLWIDVHSDLTEAEYVALASMEAGSVLERELKGRELGERGTGIGKRETIKATKTSEWWREQGYYVDFNRTARRGGYCGVRQLLVVKEGRLAEGEGNWDNLMGVVPPLGI